MARCRWGLRPAGRLSTRDQRRMRLLYARVWRTAARRSALRRVAVAGMSLKGMDSKITTKWPPRFGTDHLLCRLHLKRRGESLPFTARRPVRHKHRLGRTATHGGYLITSTMPLDPSGLSTRSDSWLGSGHGISRRLPNRAINARLTPPSFNFYFGFPAFLSRPFVTFPLLSFLLRHLSAWQDDRS